MPYYLVKADETHNIKVGDTYARTLASTINNFFVMDYLIDGMTNYYVDLPDDIWYDFAYSEWTQGKKVKRGFDPFNGTVELIDRDLPANHINYTEAQLQRRITIRKFLAKVFIDDALRQEHIDAATHASLLAEMDSITIDDDLNMFFTNLHFDD